MLTRLLDNWVYATPPVALLLVGLYPFMDSAIMLPLFLALPVYMIHQFEEHDDNRFIKFFNRTMGAGKGGLSAAGVWIINVIFVWFFLLAVFYAASLRSSLGVLAAYLLLINGLLHVGWALLFRRYNPGLWTAILLLIPLSFWIYATIPSSLSIHVISAIVVIVLHAAIMVMTKRSSNEKQTDNMGATK